MPEKLERFKLIRKYFGQDGTAGRFLTPRGSIICETLERPKTWKGIENKSDDPKTPFNESCCIPEGTYTVNKTLSPRFNREMYLLNDTHDRSGIRIHPANTIEQLLGCIAPCRSVSKNVRHSDGKIYPLYAISSKEATEALERRLPKTFILEITSEDSLCQMK